MGARSWGYLVLSAMLGCRRGRDWELLKKILPARALGQGLVWPSHGVCSSHPAVGTGQELSQH